MNNLTKILTESKKQFEELFSKREINRPNFTASFSEVYDHLTSSTLSLLKGILEEIGQVERPEAGTVSAVAYRKVGQNIEKNRPRAIINQAIKEIE